MWNTSGIGDIAVKISLSEHRTPFRNSFNVDNGIHNVQKDFFIQKMLLNSRMFKIKKSFQNVDFSYKHRHSTFSAAPTFRRSWLYMASLYLLRRALPISMHYRLFWWSAYPIKLRNQIIFVAWKRDLHWFLLSLHSRARQ